MAAQRFMRRGTTKFFFVPTIATLASPSHTEVNAGVDITPQVSEPTGFNFTNAPITTPDFESRFSPQIPGENTAAASNLQMYEIKGATDTIKAALPKDTAGFLVIFYAGTAGATPAAADKADVWPVTISANNRTYTANNEAARYTVDFAMTAEPALEATLT